MNAPMHLTRVEAELGRAMVRIAKLEEENQRLRDLMRLDIGTTPPEWCLTAKEDELVMALAGAYPAYLSTRRIIEIVWPGVLPTDRIISVMMVRLRPKLARFGIKILNIPRRGYFMEETGVRLLREFRRLAVDTARDGA